MLSRHGNSRPNAGPQVSMTESHGSGCESGTSQKLFVCLFVFFHRGAECFFCFRLSLSLCVGFGSMRCYFNHISQPCFKSFQLVRSRLGGSSIVGFTARTQCLMTSCQPECCIDDSRGLCCLRGLCILTMMEECRRLGTQRFSVSKLAGRCFGQSHHRLLGGCADCVGRPQGSDSEVCF